LADLYVLIFSVMKGKIQIGIIGTGFARTVQIPAFQAFAEEIIEALKNGETNVENGATFEDGLKVQKVLDAARESNNKHRTVEINW